MNTVARVADRPRSGRWSLWDTLRSLGGGPGHKGPRTDHFDGERFFNPGAPAGRSFKDFLRWQRTRERRPWPAWVENSARPSLPAHLAADEVALTFINHITFLLQFRDLNILTDPVYSERVSPFRNIGPRRIRNPGLPFEELPQVHLVLVTHNHYDHLDLETLMRLEAAHSPHFITTLGNRAFLQEFGLRRVTELDWWQQVRARNGRQMRTGSGQPAPAGSENQIPAGIAAPAASAAPAEGPVVTLTPAQHWSSRRPRNRNRTLWGGFMLQVEATSVFFAGDTGYGPHFHEIARRFPSIDLAMLPIGAYEPRWFMGQQHMNPDDAVRAHLDLGARISVGTHFGCFQLTDEGLDDPVHDLRTARRSHGLRADAFQVLETGETRMFRRSPAA